MVGTKLSAPFFHGLLTLAVRPSPGLSSSGTASAALCGVSCGGVSCCGARAPTGAPQQLWLTGSRARLQKLWQVCLIALWRCVWVFLDRRLTRVSCSSGFFAAEPPGAALLYAFCVLHLFFSVLHVSIMPWIT